MAGGMRDWYGWRRLLAAAVVIGLAQAAPAAAGPIETNIFAVQGVDADETAKDASAAKDLALMDVQVKAFFQLVEKLGSADVAASLKGMTPEEIAPYLKSLSIEEESSAPGRYIGKFTVRFLPGKVKALLANYGIEVPDRQSVPIIVLPLWRSSVGLQMWDDNIWRQAWLDLRAEQSLVPLIVPLGDLEDSAALSTDDVLNDDPVKLEAIKRRYDARSLVVAIAEPAEGGGVHVSIHGNTQLGKVTFDKIYTSEDGKIESAVAGAVRRFHAAMIEKYKQDESKAAAEAQAQQGGLTSSSLAVAVPFGSPTQWNGIRARILSTPNVIGVDISTLAGDGAVIRLMYTATVPELLANLQSAGLNMSQIGGTWVIQPM